jgi:hypothetical protein
MTIATPSAKAHERVTGRWGRDIEIKTPREWTIYYVKQVVGTPIPLLLCLYVLVAFFSRAGLELAAWACAGLTIAYIVADRFSSMREFSFFRIGCDLFLLGYVLVGIASALMADSPIEGLETLGGVRWVLLLYAMTYCWELFPGLNRIFGLMMLSSLVAAAYGIWQHFTGVDLIRGAELASAPVRDSIFFTPVSFFNTPENFGTLLAMAMPFPVAAYLLDERRDSRWHRFAALGICLVFVLGVLWTYRPGMWIAATAGLVVAVLMQARHGFKLLLIIAAFVLAVLFASYGSPGHLFDSVDTSETARATQQRSQLNTQVKIWEENHWIGAGRKALAAADYDPGTGNVYFQVLAQSGVLGAGFYLFIVLGFLLSTYRIFSEIPKTHYWHRVLIVGSISSQIAFHVAGLYWSTLSEALAINLFVLVVSATSYLSEHYGRGLVPDDHAI